MDLIPRLFRLVLSSAPVRLNSAAEGVQIVGMPTPRMDVTTIDELLALPEDGLRHELLGGEHVVTPSPTFDHQSVALAILSALLRVVEGRDDLKVRYSPADIVLPPDTLVQPDVFVFKTKPGMVIEQWSDVGIPLLAVEVLSPSTADRDRGTKRRLYQAAGVAEYWIVDMDARLVERWRPSDIRPDVMDAAFTWELPDGASVVFDCADFFRDLERTNQPDGL